MSQTLQNTAYVPRTGERRPVPRDFRVYLDSLSSALKQVQSRIRGLPVELREQNEGLRWVAQNGRLFRAALLDVRQLLHSRVSIGPPLETASAYLKREELKFDSSGAIAFLNQLPASSALSIEQLWALKPALQFVLLEQIVALSEELLKEPASVFPALSAAVRSLRHVSDTEWKDLFEQVSRAEQMLRQDPAGVYAHMDPESRDEYRSEVVRLARHSRFSELEVIETATALAQAALDPSAAEQPRNAHLGFYFLGKGRPEIERRIDYRSPWTERARRLLKHHPDMFYVPSIEIATLAIVVAVLAGLGRYMPFFTAFLLLLLPASQAAVELMNYWVTFLLSPCRLPKLDLSDGVPSQFATMVAVPVLLINERQVRELVDELEVRYLANQDPNIHFAILSDSPDSSARVDDKDQLAELASGLIRDLNAKYARTGMGGFFLFHRHRVYYESEKAWLGWERKRGKLLDLNKLLRNDYDSFPVKEGNTAILSGIRYVLTLDADTQLPRGAAHRMIGAIAHPLNRAVIDHRKNVVVDGYGILQPRIGVSVQSASRSRLANIFSGQTGFDIYTRAVSDVYQDLYSEGSFTGKGIYDVDVLRAVLERRFPRSALLSHDLIEGAYARAGLASDIELIDDYPSHFSAFSRRKHRWVRGDWQIVTWLFERAPDETGKNVLNPISVVSRWKILDNLRRSLVEPAEMALLLAGWFGLSGGPKYWSVVSVVLLLLPVYFHLLFSLLRFAVKPSWIAAREMVSQTVAAHFNVFLGLVFLMHQAMLDIDAIVRSNVRRLITGEKMLEWETAAEAELGQSKRTPVDTYLQLTPVVSLAIAALLYWLRPVALPYAAPFLLVWAFSGLVARWLNRPMRNTETQLGEADKQFVRQSALLTWRYFRQWSGPETNWLIPDNVQETPPRTAYRISPTNLGFLLNARLAACDLGYLSLREFVDMTEATLATMQRMPKFRGHFYNWHDTQSLEPLQPMFISSVDSGNLAGALWTLKQGCRELISKPPKPELLERGMEDFRQLLGMLAPELKNFTDTAALEAVLASDAGADVKWWAEETLARMRVLTEPTVDLTARLSQIIDDADEYVRAMEFRFLYNEQRRLLSIGFDVSAGKLAPSVYDLLASESRLGAFVAVAKGDIPQESWFRLGRSQVAYRGEQALLSWTGTMFEYLMPALWMRSYPNTLLHRSLLSSVRCQRKYAKRAGVPWGISESAYAYRDDAGNYQYQAFGLPALAMKESLPAALVISPYSTFLALAVDPLPAIANLRRLWQMKWWGSFGFYESADYSAPALAGRRGEHELVRCWMAHHQGMILLSVCNLLCDSAMQRRFHQEPQALATELILHEKALPVEAQPAPPDSPMTVPVFEGAPAA